jgi:hypothetical protein
MLQPGQAFSLLAFQPSDVAANTARGEWHYNTKLVSDGFTSTERHSSKFAMFHHFALKLECHTHHTHQQCVLATWQYCKHVSRSGNLEERQLVQQSEIRIL